ncbi:MAG: cobalt ECF transporter T component CbiQ [Thermoleophilia bacterium]
MHLIDLVAYTNRLAGRSAGEKTAFALGMLLLALLLPPWPGCVVVLVVMLVATLLVARVPFGTYRKLVVGPLAFLVVGVVPLLVSIDFGGQWLVSFHAAPGGLELAVRVTLRSLAALSCLFFLSFTTPVPQILGVMRRVRAPEVLTEVSLLIYRNIWVCVDTVRSIRAAQSSRLGYRTLRTTYRSLAMMIATFFGQTLQRARAMDKGLQARNWHGELRVLDEGARATVLGVSVVIVVQACTLAMGLLAWRAL